MLNIAVLSINWNFYQILQESYQLMRRDASRARSCGFSPTILYVPAISEIVSGQMPPHFRLGLYFVYMNHNS